MNNHPPSLIQPILSYPMAHPPSAIHPHPSLSTWFHHRLSLLTHPLSLLLSSFPCFLIIVSPPLFPFICTLSASSKAFFLLELATLLSLSHLFCLILSNPIHPNSHHTTSITVLLTERIRLASPRLASHRIATLSPEASTQSQRLSR
ncbi:hypothetical protein DER46DRAFT_316369 [Fusarium sp. MPI-SDFR-AT-0072]|nr:hypothetical protein DER46DRAFT_316369 [Fusarium sp. MPI-SDFR-AT-0072]